MNLFRKLSPEQEKSFRQWARDNYRPLTPIEGIWHPAIQRECVRMNEEAGQNLEIPGITDNPDIQNITGQQP